jgi:hypothetical protein
MNLCDGMCPLHGVLPFLLLLHPPVLDISCDTQNLYAVVRARHNV